MSIAEQAVRQAFKDKDILEDALHGDEFSQLADDEWRDIISEIWQGELADEGGLTESARKQEQEIIREAKRLYKERRKVIKDQVEQLKEGIKAEL